MAEADVAILAASDSANSTPKQSLSPSYPDPPISASLSTSSSLPSAPFSTPSDTSFSASFNRLSETNKTANQGNSYPVNKSSSFPSSSNTHSRKDNFLSTPQKKKSSHLALKEKFVVICESLFRGEDPSRGRPQQKFWADFFLLKVNTTALERCILLTSEKDLSARRALIHILFSRCCAALKLNEGQVRVAHSLEILSILLKNLFRKKFSNFSSEIVMVLTGVENADIMFRELLHSLQSILEGECTQVDLVWSLSSVAI